MRITYGQSTCSSRRIRKKLCFSPTLWYNNRRNRERGRGGKYPRPARRLECCLRDVPTIGVV